MMNRHAFLSTLSLLFARPFGRAGKPCVVDHVRPLNLSGFVVPQNSFLVGIGHEQPSGCVFPAVDTNYLDSIIEAQKWFGGRPDSLDAQASGGVAKS